MSQEQKCKQIAEAFCSMDSEHCTYETRVNRLTKYLISSGAFALDREAVKLLSQMNQEQKCQEVEAQIKHLYQDADCARKFESDPLKWPTKEIVNILISSGAFTPAQEAKLLLKMAYEAIDCVRIEMSEAIPVKDNEDLVVFSCNSLPQLEEAKKEIEAYLVKFMEENKPKASSELGTSGDKPEGSIPSSSTPLTAPVNCMLENDEVGVSTSIVASANDAVVTSLASRPSDSGDAMRLREMQRISSIPEISMQEETSTKAPLLSAAGWFSFKEINFGENLGLLYNKFLESELLKSKGDHVIAERMALLKLLEATRRPSTEAHSSSIPPTSTNNLFAKDSLKQNFETFQEVFAGIQTDAPLQVQARLSILKKILFAIKEKVLAFGQVSSGVESRHAPIQQTDSSKAVGTPPAPENAGAKSVGSHSPSSDGPAHIISCYQCEGHGWNIGPRYGLRQSCGVCLGTGKLPAQVGMDSRKGAIGQREDIEPLKADEKVDATLVATVPAEGKIPPVQDICPHCKTDLQKGATSDKIAVIENDRIAYWKCPICGGIWDIKTN